MKDAKDINYNQRKLREIEKINKREQQNLKIEKVENTDTVKKI